MTVPIDEMNMNTNINMHSHDTSTTSQNSNNANMNMTHDTRNTNRNISINTDTSMAPHQRTPMTMNNPQVPVPVPAPIQSLMPASSTREDTNTVAGYTLQQKLGSGSFASVYKASKEVEDENGSGNRRHVVAIKAIDRKSNKITPKVLSNLNLEITILKTPANQHPNIVSLHQYHKSSRYVYLILEYCAGGDLQGLIRSRKNGRLSERLSRRLMRDLTNGLMFMAGRNLIHRDIKPQNLLLTRGLPREEVNDPPRDGYRDEDWGDGDGDEDVRFHLKIADFGFARHLQKTSLAETLCGSPLYMAPEILQHKRYDNKADLWSAGTVLFEMIAGRPPFHGENHIDLLRNIQQKAVRLPPGLKVSKECVTLLRILLNRNPLARAGFRDFVKASEDFVALGCLGSPCPSPKPVGDNGGSAAGIGDASISGSTGGIGGSLHSPQHANLGPISEVEESHLAASTNMHNSQMEDVATPMQDVVGTGAAFHGHGISNANSPRLIPLQHAHTHAPNSPVQHHTHAYNNHSSSRPNSHFTPLEPSPPGPRQLPVPDGMMGMPPMSLKSQLDSRGQVHVSQSSIHGNYNPYKKSDSQHSDGSSSGGFVMVEKGGSSSVSASATSGTSNSHSHLHSPSSSRTPLTAWKQTSTRRVIPASALGGKVSPPGSPRSNNRFFSGKALLATRHMIPPSIPFVKKGMLSTSPGTGGALVGMMGAGSNSSNSKGNNAMTTDRSMTMTPAESISLESTTKMLSAADDVGRRAINVAHVGDTRAYLAMRLIITNDTTSLHSSSGMEGVEEETDDQIAAHDDEFTVPNRARAISTDQSSTRRSGSNDHDDDGDDEMPFAMGIDDEEDDPIPDVCAVVKYGFAQEESCSTSNIDTKSSRTPNTILMHFKEALACYMKSLSMLKGSLNASKQVLTELNRSSASSSPSSRTESFLQFKNRCEVSHNWLSGQFKGVLERADAANSEISKLLNFQSGAGTALNNVHHVLGVEELIYNHSLACGKDGAVKQLLGQYDSARSCYRSAGLLAETLLMESKLGEEDRKTLEEYVQGFSERINEIDYLMIQQSRHSVGSNSSFKGAMGSTVSSRRSSSNNIVPLVGPQG